MSTRFSSSVSGRRPVSARRAVGALERRATGILTALCLMLAVEVISASGLVSTTTVPATSTVLRALGDEMGSSEFWTATGHTMAAWAIGLALALVAAIPVGFAIGRVGLLRAGTKVLMEFFRPIPGVTVLPLLVLVIGLDVRMEVVLVAVGAFWPLLYQVSSGTRDVDPLTIDVARAYRLPVWLRTSRIVLPSAAPYIATGVRISASIALIVAIGTELIVDQAGLGAAIYGAEYAGSIPSMYALIAVTGIIGVLVNALFRRAERSTLSWHPSNRGLSWR